VTGFVDYVLWGHHCKPLAVSGAKGTRRDGMGVQQQAKLHADFLEKTCRQRPVIFCTNGYEHSLWEDVRCPAREVKRFFTRDELALVIARRSSRMSHWLHVDADSDERRTFSGADTSCGLRPERLTL
jgi:type I restriction enzyme, R subunit